MTTILRFRAYTFFISLGIILFFFSVLNFVGFIRDALLLPLYNGRTEILECLLLVVAILLIQQGNMYLITEPPVSNEKDDKFRRILFQLGIPVKYSKHSLILLVLLIVLVPVSLLNNSQYFFFALQLSKFILSLIICSLLVQQNVSIINIERVFRFFVYLMCFTLISLLIVNKTGIVTNFDDLVQRNMWCLSASFYIYFFALRRTFVRFSGEASIVLLMAWIASAKLSILLVIISPLLYIFFRKRVDSISTKGVAACVTFGIVVLLPYILPPLLRFEYEDLYILEESRYYISDNVGSLISRIFSVRHLLDNGYLLHALGLGEMRREAALFWGYPVHNLPFQLGYSHGIVGWLISIVMLGFFVKYTRNFYEIIFVVCVMCYLNDVLTVTIICYTLACTHNERLVK